MNGTMIQHGSRPDAQLVAESRRGNREAFGHIVRRYQGMVTGVIYSCCGDFHRSEDLAQETFISAWKSLSAMKDAEKLAPWLCQIARHKALDSLRAGVREKDRLTNLFRIQPSPAPASPSDEALASEERALLWRVLSELPQPYRETMVLYYRQEQSTAAVARAMGVNEDVVRQRLARGREMLRDELTQIMERNLVHSAPGPAFASVVLAALPAVAPAVAKAATLGAAAKGSASLGGSSAISWVATLFGPLVAFSGGLLAIRNGLRSAQSPRERRFILWFAVLFGLFMAAPFVMFIVLSKIFPGHGVHGFEAMWTMLVFTIAATVLIVLGRRKWNAIRQSEPRAAESPAPGSCARARMPLWLIVGIVLSSLAWMFDLAWRARDTFSVAVLSALAIALTVCAAYCWRYASAVVARVFTVLYVPIVGLVTLITMNWRLLDWIAVVDHERHPHPITWNTLALMAIAFACAEVLMLALLGRNKEEVPKR
jgi:RNA polymerase sigma factor (sigma-70 family)